MEAEKQIDALNKMGVQLKHAEGNKSQEYVCVKTYDKLTKMDEEKNKQHITSDETVMFTAELSIKSYLQQLKILGRAISTKSAVQKIQQAAKPHSNFLSVTLPETKLYKVSKQREINVKFQDDKMDCDICDLCITEGGMLLLVDYRNKKLKRLNLSTEALTDYLSLTTFPNAVCQVSMSAVAVSLENRTVQLVSMGGEMMIYQNLSFNHECKGVSYHSGKLFISTWGVSVYMCDMKGNLLKRITTDGSGKNVFQYNRHITVSPEGDNVFVADGNKGLITLDNQGNYLATLNTSDIYDLKLRGVYTDDKYIYMYAVVVLTTSSS